MAFLPAYDHVILDEGHALEDVAAEHFGLSISESQVAHLLTGLWEPSGSKGFLVHLAGLETGSAQIDAAIKQVQRCRDHADNFFNKLEQYAQSHGAANGRITERNVVEESLSASLSDLAELLNIIRQSVDDEQSGFELGSFLERAREQSQTIEGLLNQVLPGCVYCVEVDQAGKRATSSSH